MEGWGAGGGLRCLGDVKGEICGVCEDLGGVYGDLWDPIGVWGIWGGVCGTFRGSLEGSLDF